MSHAEPERTPHRQPDTGPACPSSNVKRLTEIQRLGQTIKKLREENDNLFLTKQKTVVANRELKRELATERERTIQIVMGELDNCDHPECADVRAKKGYADCAGGHLARRVVEAIRKGK